MKKGPEFRVVGNIPEEAKKEKREKLEGYLFEQFAHLPPKTLEFLKAHEIPKTPDQKALIGFADRITNAARNECGLPSYEVPMDNFHIIPKEKWNNVARNPNVEAITQYGRQAVFMKAGKIFDPNASEEANRCYFGSIAVHEMFHLKGFYSAQAHAGKFFARREGVTAFNVPQYTGEGHVKNIEQGTHNHFYGLHEAIVSLAQRKTFLEMLDEPAMSSAREKFFSEDAIAFRRMAAKEFGMREDEILWAEKDAKENIRATPFPFLANSRALEYVMGEIQKDEPERFASADDVFREFLKAQFSGKLLELGRLMKHSFGSTAFRALGNMEATRESGVNHLELLRAMRREALQARAKKHA